MLRMALMVGALAVVFAVAWLALRRTRRQPEAETGLDDEGYLRNIRATTGDYGKGSPPQGEM